MRRVRVIPQRRRIFLGCEGESERSYGRLLSNLLERQHRRTHIETHVLQPGAGDPQALVAKAVDLIARKSDRTVPFAARAVLIDGDVRDRRPDQTRRAVALARRNDIRIIWQDPCHEAFLLRHLESCATLQPSDAGRAEQDLLRRWPEYYKALPATRLATMITEAGVLQAAEVIIPDLAAFLADIEFARI